jgi:hypothetical protein
MERRFRDDKFKAGICPRGRTFFFLAQCRSMVGS